MNTTTNHIQRIYNCRNDHQRVASRIDYRAVTTWDNNYPVETHYFIGSHEIFGIDKKCPQCNQWMIQNDVFAILNEERECDLKCMNAIGPKCVCGCGGPNHGINWLINDGH